MRAAAEIVGILMFFSFFLATYSHSMKQTWIYWRWNSFHVYMHASLEKCHVQYQQRTPIFLSGLLEVYQGKWVRAQEPNLLFISVLPHYPSSLSKARSCILNCFTSLPLVWQHAVVVQWLARVKSAPWFCTYASAKDLSLPKNKKIRDQCRHTGRTDIGSCWSLEVG